MSDLRLTSMQMKKLKDRLMGIDTNQHQSFTLSTTNDGQLLMEKWSSGDVTVERISAPEPKLEVLNCIG